MILAAKIRHEEMALYLLKKIENINLNHLDNDGMSALHYACILGQLNLVKTLIAMGANINATNKKNRSPLDCIVLNREETESILKSASIEPSRDEAALQNSVVDHNKQPLISFSPTKSYEIPAIKNNSILVIDVIKKGIIDSDALINLKIQKASEKIEQYVLDQMNQFTGTSVIERCMVNRFQVMSYLVKQGADYSWLLRYFSSNANMKNLHYLLSQPNLTQFLNQPGLPSGRTALHQAALNGHIEASILENLAQPTTFH